MILTAFKKDLILIRRSLPMVLLQYYLTLLVKMCIRDSSIPCSLAEAAAASPAGPPPTMTISYESMLISSFTICPY